MASVSASAPRMRERQLLFAVPSSSDTPPSAMPTTTEDATRSGRQVIAPPTMTRRHADVVHRADAEADDGAGQRHVRAPIAERGVPEAAADDRDGDRQREQRDGDVVAERHAGGCRQASRRSASSRCRSRPRPRRSSSHGAPHRPVRAARMVEQRHARERRERADQSRDDDEAKVVMLERASSTLCTRESPKYPRQ